MKEVRNMSEILEAPAKKPKLQEEDEQDGSEPSALKKKTPETKQAKECPYLDTINRHVLDFDFEKLCSVSLSRINVYACLVCGKYFQGRGLSTHAYTHSVSEGHHVFLNLQTLKFYCLPDQYEIIDSSLEDIKYVLNPTFERSAIARLDTQESLSRAYDGSNYLPGTVGLNNIKANDYCNVIFQALSNVVPIRDYFLDESNYSAMKPPPGDNMFLLVQRFGELVRKLWNPRNFKAHVSPHEMLQAVVLCSRKRFQFTDQGDPVTFLSWFLNALHMALGGTKKRNSSIIYKAFQGRMRVYSRRMPPEDLTAEQKKELLETPEYQETREEMPFLYLTADLPAPPLFRDELKENIIPQVSLFTLLNKFNGKEEKEYKTYKEEIVKRFELTRLPPYLILCIKRFTKNTFFVEKNPTIVNFPIKNIDLAEYLAPDCAAAAGETVYDLITNIVHDGEPGAGKGTYRCHTLHRGTGRWYELQDLHVRDILPQMITLTESYIQIYELRQTPTDKS
ncbi:U4/U6.U5 tri-snRNP-associated protein 2-like isoform X2 [Amphibalanus amphitrite]|uniref:U4/U6.U5 tri-snRNP-associated protein 2-like isoform X2 n=1 Tax=Amphibalanus amphitrite TaxID=1232801 RepID=UPI001C91FBE4|nr:U4/U6.U5 tri-snRNP-associated protein 2-like isoform X2 [Amphibalanus amphitrite]